MSFFRFIFTEYGKVSTLEGEKANAGMIAELAINVEETYGFVATRLCRALHSKGLFGKKHRSTPHSSIRFKSPSISIHLLYSCIRGCHSADSFTLRSWHPSPTQW